jgi:hypothetical protein
MTLKELARQSNKKIHTVSLNPNIMAQFTEACERKYSIRKVVEELIKAFIDARKERESIDRRRIGEQTKHIIFGVGCYSGDLLSVALFYNS